MHDRPCSRNTVNHHRSTTLHGPSPQRPGAASTVNSRVIEGSNRMDAADATSARHVPVLFDRVLALLGPAIEGPDAVVVDATLGLAGHAEGLLRAHPAVRLVGIDRDADALALARLRLAPFEARITLVHAVYDELPIVLARLGFDQVQGVLFDLGVSSLQLDVADRGFSYSKDAPLDMRMDRSQGATAADVLNNYPTAEIARILRWYGEEKFAARIAAAIVKERERHPLDSTARLAELVRDSIPAAARRTGGNPAKRTFQALRIEVNAELAALEGAIPAAVGAIGVGGRVVVLSYQSLEDRLVKRVFADGAASTSPAGLPVELPDHAPRLRLLTRGAETPTPAEIEANPRAASAKLRAVERVRIAA
jgi:16S rRNA (cytosine1402-N4)-methyltransferase